MSNQNGKAIADWTVLLYIAGNDHLANFGIESLKQIKRSAGNGVVVAVQFDGSQDIRRFVFDGTGQEQAPLSSHVRGQVTAPLGMAAPQTLMEFMDWACELPENQARHYCLVLWGHGPQLLMDDRASAEPEKKKMYLTPVELGRALRNTKLVRNRKLDIIGMDACAMSMIEVACELQDCADYLIASQEDVPAAGFPYDRFLQLLREKGDDVPGVCGLTVREYKAAYEDYIFSARTKTPSVTLSSLRLQNVSLVTHALKELTQALQESVTQAASRQAIISSRGKAAGFAGGLFVDLYSFCDCLRQELHAANLPNQELSSACERICGIITDRGENSFVVENQTMQPGRSYGLSIYFPYLQDVERN